MTDPHHWIGRTQTQSDVATAGPLAGLAALLNHVTPPWQPGLVPPLGHFLYFLPRTLQSHLDIDGHARRGDFLPPVSLPRRMWAGSDIVFLAPLPLGAAIERRSTIRDVTQKSGASGSLVFVSVEHEISAAGMVCVSERQDIVYREAGTAGAAAAPPPPPRACQWERQILLDPTHLFRFSALTFNAHRIHYDREYARHEGYPGLVVQGPFIAVLLMDLALRDDPARSVTRFSFRARRPLIEGAPATLCASRSAGGLDLWCRDAEGHETMSAALTWQ